MFFFPELEQELEGQAEKLSKTKMNENNYLGLLGNKPWDVCGKVRDVASF